MTTQLQRFDDPKSPEGRIREDLVEAHRHAWTRLANAGTWWTGTERVAIAAESRAAAYCRFCRERKAGLSPYAVEGEHDQVSRDRLPPAAIDAIHRLVTDATRLSKSWVEGLADEGVPDTHYVELLSIVVCVRSVDVFHRAMGIEPEPLPEPVAGEPTRRRPEAAVGGVAWVPMLPSRAASGEEADLFPGPMPNVIRAMSLVPEAVRWLNELSAAQYLSVDGGEMFDFVNGKGPLDRAQTELIAGRVSAVNECFY
ncbi:MAG: hypothetical protein GY910_27510 [bacterium]|nr:hypothetical protein [bacterium]